ncbi:MAG: hypothetical protein ACFFC7_11890 [Candidatus Hermodarchaeota archaeon]
MVKLQSQRRQKITYEDAIRYLIEKETQVLEARKQFVSKYRGLLNHSKAIEDLKGARDLERK